MKDYTAVVFVRHAGCSKYFLFEAPNTWGLSDGDDVLCATSKGEQRGNIVGAPLHLDAASLATVAKAVGATMPLQRIAGRYEFTRFMYENEKPAGVVTTDGPVDG